MAGRGDSWNQPVVDDGSPVDMLVLRFAKAAAIPGCDWLLPVVLRWSPGDGTGIYDGDPCDEFRKYLVRVSTWYQSTAANAKKGDRITFAESQQPTENVI